MVPPGSVGLGGTSATVPNVDHDDPFGPGPTYDELADQATAGQYIKAPRDMLDPKTNAVVARAGEPISLPDARRCGLTVMVAVR